MRPLVRLEGLRLDEDWQDGRHVVATVRLGLRDDAGDHWAEERVEHVDRFGADGLVSRMGARRP